MAQCRLSNCNLRKAIFFFLSPGTANYRHYTYNSKLPGVYFYTCFLHPDRLNWRGTHHGRGNRFLRPCFPFGENALEPEDKLLYGSLRPLKIMIYKWCGREDSNFQGSPRHHLKVVRLPIPPRPHTYDAFKQRRMLTFHKNGDRHVANITKSTSRILFFII